MSDSQTTNNDKANTEKYLTFLLNERSYAVSILKVKEILEYGVVTPIPKMPDFICGAINLRGEVVPVIDLTHCLGQASSEIGKRSCIVIIEISQNDVSRNVGIIVDAVSKVMDFHASEIEEAPKLGENINTDFIEGMGKIDNKFVIILDIDRIMSLTDFEELANQ